MGRAEPAFSNVIALVPSGDPATSRPDRARRIPAATPAPVRPAAVRDGLDLIEALASSERISHRESCDLQELRGYIRKLEAANHRLEQGLRPPGLWSGLRSWMSAGSLTG